VKHAEKEDQKEDHPEKNGTAEENNPPARAQGSESQAHPAEVQADGASNHRVVERPLQLA
jgi:hypothetical protein